MRKFIKKKGNYDIVKPRADAMIESLRAFGYNITTAIADLLDNSITAEAQNIWIYFHWNGSDSYITITDDGKGMTEDRLINAMRPGSQNPLIPRDPKDMGRFGLGLKTASFSQCRRLTVATKTTLSGVKIRRWDLDYISKVNEWRLLRSAYDGSQKHICHIDSLNSGTVILWECLDRITGDVSVSDRIAHDRFLAMINTVQEHLAMVFHKYLEGNKPRLKIYINGFEEIHRIKHWDPYLEENPATIIYPVEHIHLAGGVISVRGYVLPHKDKLSEDQYRNASGPAGWNGQQGFYIYRNDRLLVAGS